MSVPTLSPAVVPVTSHPTACPAWCRDRHFPAGHSVSPSSTAHLSPELRLAGSDRDAAVMLRAELFRLDEDGERSDTALYVTGEGDLHLNGPEADIFIAQAQAFVDSLRILRAQLPA